MQKRYAVSELVTQAGEGPIWRVVLRDQAIEDGAPEQVLIDQMSEVFQVMREAAAEGMDPQLRSMSGMTGGAAAKYRDAVRLGRTAGGALLGEAASRALAVAELNAAMGRIVAAPTAGACGVLPGVLLALQEAHGIATEDVVKALFTAAGVGAVIAQRASISGAEGGCQAEVGTAAAMAAAAAVELRGGTARQAADAVAFALMNLMGLVCDPVGGLVEVPCVYRNVAGVSVALTAADLALSGTCSILPADEVIDAMGRVGRMLPAALRETGEGGCASCVASRA
ncbi:MAG: L-serine ammonia-lyase, iron-sulfur-dependent, subunit alpha [Eubacteriales bacterium]|nr:L-serine ammonia-lyase, iron-sulfur-dependent, subunit alpha [Christensenellaceae bacterium]MEA5065960.1 L-serine ammonia-lyase, iron-sulfur-dependent, subunit alpha [Eubacteriales bacterium]